MLSSGPRASLTSLAQDQIRSVFQLEPNANREKGNEGIRLDAVMAERVTLPGSLRIPFSKARSTKLTLPAVPEQITVCLGEAGLQGEQFPSDVHAS
jgi:hypothetical protein